MVTTRSNTSINQDKSPRERKKKTASEPATNGKASLNGHGAAKSSSNGGVAETRELSHDEGNFLWRFWHYTLVPIVLMVATPTFNVLLSYTVQKCEGSVTELVARLTENGLGNGIARVYAEVSWGSNLACGVILSYLAWAVLLMKLLPGKRVQGPVTPKGNVPVYKDNGFYCYVLTMLAFGGLTYFLHQRGLTPTIVYDHFHEFLGALTLYSHALCVFLYIKGLFFPSTSDCGSSGNPIFDYFWGTELYPRILGIDIKVLTNCRFGMTVWPLLCVIFALKSYELYGFVDSMWVSCVLQLVYITKFFWWEAGYMGTIDIMMDRAGYCICWGCLAFIPGMYTSVSFFLVSHPIHLGPGLSCLILAFGLLSIAVNYLADAQKQAVRASDGRAAVWGRPPAVIRAKYRLESGAVHESLLLVCGYWGIARHFHYVPEIALALAWTLPALFSHALPFSYVVFLTVLLSHRTVRDDAKCSKKYQRYWAEYCQRVPYRIIPYVF
jgi:7-dehydrocholesterol reductase